MFCQKFILDSPYHVDDTLPAATETSLSCTRGISALINDDTRYAVVYFFAVVRLIQSAMILSVQNTF